VSECSLITLHWSIVTIDQTGLRTKILDAAERVIRTRGIGGATTREIARSAGCAEGSLYNHFPCKEDLVMAVFVERLPGFIALLRDLPARAGTRTVRANLEEVVEAALDFYTEVIPLTASMVADPDLRRRHRKAHGDRKVGPQRAYQQVGDYLRAEQRLGRLGRRADPEAATGLLLGACYQAALIEQLTGEEADTDGRFARRTVRTLLQGLAPKE
jgi:AcrR family transcriptional regulator